MMRLYLAAGAVVVAMGALYGAYAAGQANARQEAAEQAHKAYRDTIERVLQNETVDLDDPAAVLDRLRELAGQ